MGRLFVGNLSWTTGDAELREISEAKGIEVTKVSVINDRETGRSRGFGFVEIEGSVQEAIEALNGANLGGRDLRVNEAHERERKPRRDPPREQRTEPTPHIEERRGGGKGKSRRRRGDGDKYDSTGW